MKDVEAGLTAEPSTGEKLQEPRGRRVLATLGTAMLALVAVQASLSVVPRGVPQLARAGSAVVHRRLASHVEVKSDDGGSDGEGDDIWNQPSDRDDAAPPLDGPVTFDNCKEQFLYALEGVDAKDPKTIPPARNDIATGCYLFALADLIALIALIIVCCGNCARYCPRGCNAAPKPIESGYRFDNKDTNRPCACICSTLTGFWAVILVPFGVLIYIIFAPFTCCANDDDGNKFHNFMAGGRDTGKWLMQAPYKIGGFFASGCNC